MKESELLPQDPGYYDFDPWKCIVTEVIFPAVKTGLHTAVPCSLAQLQVVERTRCIIKTMSSSFC